MDDKEKALEQLSGRVTESQKVYFNNEMEGSFSDKIAELIKEHKVRVKDNSFNVETNKAAIQQALNVIVKNMDIIELNARNYVQDIKSDIEVRVNALEEDSTELNNVKEENESLKEEIDNASNQMEVLNSMLFESKKKFDEDLANADIKYSKLKEEDDKLQQDHIKLRLQFGDMKEDLTDKNIALTEKLNKLKEDHNQEVNKLKSDYENLKETLTNKIAQLKEDHAAELSKLNKEAQDKINGVSSDYTKLKIQTDKMIANLDKALGIAKSQLESKDNSIKEKLILIEQLEKDAAWLKPFASVNIQYQNRIYQLEKLLKDNGIEFNIGEQK